MQNLRWKGNQPGDVIIPFGGVGGEAKGFISTNVLGDIWICEIDQFQLGFLLSEIEVHRGALQSNLNRVFRMRIGHMIVHKDQMAIVDENEEVKQGYVQYQLPKQFWKPENQENRVYWNKVFGTAADFLVINENKNVLIEEMIPIV